MAITTAMEVTLIIFSEDGSRHLGYLKITNDPTLNKIFWTTFNMGKVQDDYGMGKQEGSIVFLCPGQTPADEHTFAFNHSKECSKLHGFSLMGFDTEQIFDLEVKTRVTTPFKAKCKFLG